MNSNDGTLPLSLTIDGIRHEILPSESPCTPGGITVCVNQTTGRYGYRTLSIANRSDSRSRQITEPYTLDYTVNGVETLRLHTLRGDDCSRNSFLPVDRVIEPGETLTLAPEGGRSSNTTAFPFLDLTFGGRAMLIAIGWSGQWKCTIARGEQSFRITVGLENADFYLNPHESVQLPSVLVLEGDSAPKLRRQFRSILLDDFNPMPNRGGRHAALPLAIQPYDRYFYGKCPKWPTTAGQLRTLERSALCGSIDTLWLDAAWFRDGFPNGVGNYSFAEGFPEGLKPVSDAVHAAGMKFMVWFEPERVCRGSEVFTEHPEFLLSVKGDEYTYLYNLGDDAAWTWLFHTLTAMIRDNGIDNFRQDFNMNPLPYWLAHDPDGRTGITEITYVNGFYRLWDRLKAIFPDLLIDNCASGGRRIDLETVKRAVPMWRSDITCGPMTETSRNDVYNQNQTLCLSDYLPYHACAAWEPIPNEIRSARTAGLACTFDILNPDFDFQQAGRILSETKRTAGYWEGDFYALTLPTLEENAFSAYQLAKADSGYAAFFRRAACDCAEFRFVPNGIDRQADYQLTETDERFETVSYRLSGQAFADGIAISIPNRRESRILEYQKLSNRRE